MRIYTYYRSICIIYYRVMRVVSLSDQHTRQCFRFTLSPCCCVHCCACGIKSTAPVVVVESGTQAHALHKQQVLVLLIRMLHSTTVQLTALLQCTHTHAAD
jgi:hypothetical protein